MATSEEHRAPHAGSVVGVQCNQTGAALRGLGTTAHLALAGGGGGRAHQLWRARCALRPQQPRGAGMATGMWMADRRAHTAFAQPCAHAINSRVAQSSAW